MFSIPTYGPGTPFFTGVFSDPNVTPQAVSLDGVDYPIDLREFRHSGVQRFRNGVVTSNEVNDALLNPDGAWWRYRFSWHQGAGQEIDELDPDALPARYEASRGVDPWTKYQLCLLPATETKNNSLTASDIKMVSTGNRVYVSDGTTVKFCSDLSAGTPTWTSITGLSGTVNDLATDGSSVYIATTADVYVVSSASSAAAAFSSAGTADYTTVDVVANRLIASKDNVIGELSTSAFTAVYTHIQAGFVWTAVFDVGSRIYLGGYVGNRSELYTVATDDVGSLVLSSEAATFFAGELLNDALSYGGSVLLATTKGIRFAQLGGDGTLSYGPVISDFGGGLCIAAEGRFAYVGVENFPDSGSGLVRLALDEFIDTLLPAYATDLFTATSAAVKAVARFDGETVFALAADEVYGEDTTYVTTGYLDSGDITFGTVEDKAVSSLRVQYVQLAANESVAVALTDKAGTSIGTKTDASDSSDEMTLDVVGNSVDRARVRITLNGDGTTTPCLRQWRMRAYPVAPGVEEFIVPLIIHSRVVVSDGDGQILSLDPWTETERLREIWQTQEIVLFKLGDYAFRVRIDTFQISAAEWRDGADYLETTCTVRLLTT